jgi:hypothetical protein
MSLTGEGGPRSGGCGLYILKIDIIFYYLKYNLDILSSSVTYGATSPKGGQLLI